MRANVNGVTYASVLRAGRGIKVWGLDIAPLERIIYPYLHEIRYI